ncbi:MAG: hypothetical protein LBQ75_05185 [Zoogloeaceae bacterium]|jgi:hypothetical protein|nr:hypothetical protein [Zoogloeaceae bacterium]
MDTTDETKYEALRRIGKKLADTDASPRFVTEDGKRLWSYEELTAQAEYWIRHYIMEAPQMEGAITMLQWLDRARTTYWHWHNLVKDTGCVKLEDDERLANLACVDMKAKEAMKYLFSVEGT